MNPSLAHRAGIVGMSAAVLWLITLILEYSLGLYPPDGEGLLYVLNQMLVLIALTGFAYG